MTQSYFIVPKGIRLSYTHYLIMNIHSKESYKVLYHSADIDYKYFMNISRIYTNKPYSFLAIDFTLPADNPLRLEKIF